MHRNALFAGVIGVAGAILAPSQVRADCVFTIDFTAEHDDVCVLSNANYYTPTPFSLAPDSSGLWDSDAEGGTGSEIVIVNDGGGNQAVQITGSGGRVKARRTFGDGTLNCGPPEAPRGCTVDACGTDGLFHFSARVKAGTGSDIAPIWGLEVGTAAGNVLQWRGGANFIYGTTAELIPAASTPTSVTRTLTGTYATISALADVQSHVAEYFFNGASMGGPIAIAGGGRVDRLSLYKLNNSSGAGHTALIDDVLIEKCNVACVAKITPYLPRAVSSTGGPSTVVYTIKNRGSSNVTYTISESDVNGNAVNHPWLNLSTGSVGPVAPGGAPTFFASFTPTGTPGVYTGYIKIAEGCSSRYYLRQINYFEGLAAGCFGDGFSYANGELAPNGGWVNSGGAGAILVDTNSMKMIMGTAGNSADVSGTKTVSCSPCIDGKITAVVKMKASASGTAGNGWHLFFNSSSGQELAHWRGSYNSAQGQLPAGSSILTSSGTLTDTSRFYELKVVMDVANHTTSYYFDGNFSAGVDGTLLGVLNNGVDSNFASLGGTSIGQVIFDRNSRSDLSGSSLFDDLQIVTCGSCGITVLPDAPGRLINYADFASAEVGSVADRPAWDFFIYNNSSSSLTFNVHKSDINGNANDSLYPWLSLDYNSRPLDPDQPHELDAAHIDTAGLTAGEYIGLLKFTDSCSPANTYALRTVKLIMIEAADQHTCYIDSFSLPRSSLNSQQGWGGSAGSAINLVNDPNAPLNGVVKALGQPGGLPAFVSADAYLSVDNNNFGNPDPNCNTICTNPNSIISAKVKVKAGAGTGTLCKITFLDNDASIGPNQMAMFQLGGTTVKGRVGPPACNDHSTGTVNLSGPTVFDTLEAQINTSETQTVGGIPPNSTRFLMNGVPLPGTPFDPACPPAEVDPLNPISHAGSSNVLAQVSIARETGGTPSDFLIIDDIAVTYCVPVCNDPVFDVRTQTNEVNPDTHVDSHDFDNAYLPCVEALSGAPVAGDRGRATVDSYFDALSFECKCMDVNGDHALDLEDFAYYERCYSGSSAVADPNCDNP